VIVGGLGGIGRSIARWFAKHGARHLILISRSGGDEQGRKMVADLQAEGITVQSLACDIAHLPSLQEGIEKYRQIMPPIRGCVQAAMVLRVSSFRGTFRRDA
jgi:NAD(P)-dependent dehydrogenase (short-subunit alcohol dehydrogenase family)